MLPYEVTFVAKEETAIRGGRLSEMGPDELKDRIDGQSAWILLPYLHLKRAGCNVSISSELKPGGICVLAPYKFMMREMMTDCFTVGCRMDWGRPVLCDMTIVQNEANVEGLSDVFIPHWPQPGLIPRESGRGGRIETLAFKGRAFNLHEPFRSPEFRAALEGLGVRLALDFNDETRAHGWHDYSEADLVLAVRDLTKQDALIKPASKLVNARIAGTPAILGPEPAFRDLRRSDLDYFEVRTPEDVLAAVRRLK